MAWFKEEIYNTMAKRSNSLFLEALKQSMDITTVKEINLSRRDWE